MKMLVICTFFSCMFSCCLINKTLRRIIQEVIAEVRAQVLILQPIAESLAALDLLISLAQVGF